MLRVFGYGFGCPVEEFRDSEFRRGQAVRVEVWWFVVAMRVPQSTRRPFHCPGRCIVLGVFHDSIMILTIFEAK